MEAGSADPPLYLPTGKEFDTIMENLFNEYSEMTAEPKKRLQDTVEHASLELNIPSLQERQAWSA